MKKTEKLSSFEWSLIFGSMRYFMGRKSIAATSFPWELIKNYFGRLSQCQKEMLANDIEQYLNEYKLYEQVIDDNTIIWVRLMKLLDEKSYVKYKYKNKIRLGIIIDDYLYDVKKMKSSFHYFHYMQGIKINDKTIEIIK